MLRLWALPLAGDWTELVIELSTAAELAGVSRSVKPRSSFGGPTWQQERARTMALETTLRPLEPSEKKNESRDPRTAGMKRASLSYSSRVPVSCPVILRTVA